MTTENPGFSVFNSIAEIPAGFGPSVAAIGNFDGVHLGHREILAAVVEEARASGARAVAITFDPHPLRLLKSVCPRFPIQRSQIRDDSWPT